MVYSKMQLVFLLVKRGREEEREVKEEREGGKGREGGREEEREVKEEIMNRNKSPRNSLNVVL